MRSENRRRPTGVRPRSPGNRAVGRWLVVWTVIAAVVAVATPAGATPPASYFDAAFRPRLNPVSFGQDPTWTPGGRVLSNQPDRGGVKQVYVSDLDGTRAACLTCGQPGPNAFPVERPQGDWILFCSWRGTAITYGSPCLGGFGSDLYLMRPDGSHVTRLSSPGSGFEPGGLAFDNYHPAFSPDGTQLTWTHVSYGAEAAGGTRWTILLADLDLSHGSPRLVHVRTIAPAGNTAYETQEWAPDGSGLLYTSLAGTSARSGWLNTELFYLRLHGKGATPAHPVVRRLTDGDAGWDEQAVFAPDMRSVIWMSSRATPTWYETIVTAARQLGYFPPRQNEVVGPMFVATISDPRFRTDLYMLDLRSGATRRLTDLGGVIPEFTFDPSGTRVLWSEGNMKRRTFVATFDFAGEPPTAVGAPVTVDPAWSGVVPAVPASQVLPHVTMTAVRPPGRLPQPVIAGAILLKAQLRELARRIADLAAGPGCCD